MADTLPPKRLVTVADVARAAQVSKATAARALGGYGTVSEALKQRIVETAERLDYRPNELARTMATGRSLTIGAVVGDIENPFFGLLVRGITDSAKALGFGVILANSGEDVAEERTAVAMLMAKRVDGLIVAPASMRDGAHLRDAQARGLPLVFVDREVEGLEVDAALVDDGAAARRATRLLVAAGHRRIAYLTATDAPEARFRDLSQIVLTTVLGRLSGFLDAAAAAGLEAPERFVRLNAGAPRAAQAILAELLTGADRPTAILASDSKIALEVFRAARTLGLAIPRDLSLVTFDDAEWTSALSPAVTVLAQPSYDLGGEAMRMLAERIEGRREVRRRVFDTPLIERESVAPPPILAP
ncbi:LacI family transcriptional regulator [Aureimonas endophytica]|uniref:LacI family transcriptional regulator n=1 Tax=Aureimonas endophytica TaxID=2027858 RepID=A0A917A3J5_9HYPH|nr:LacI family DNA-binding transcriptional regulator [Aureimonas endophytica]GGE23287.1 LacI family transcriptional regulator [Aureimonas endophytica]